MGRAGDRPMRPWSGFWVRRLAGVLRARRESCCPVARRLIRWLRKLRTNSTFTTCQGTCGSGAKTCARVILKHSQSMGVHIWAQAPSDDSAVAATTTGICIAASGGGMELPQTSTMDALVSGWCLRRNIGQQPNGGVKLSARFARRSLRPRR